MSDILIANGVVVFPEFGQLDTDVRIEDGRVTSIGKNLPRGNAEVIDAAGLMVLPGFVDPHVHLGNYRSFEEDCESESRAAARGGVTTIITFLKVLRHRETEQSYLPVIDEVRDAIRSRSLVDVGIHLALSTEEHLQELSAYHERGVRSFKMYLGYRSDPAARRRGSVGVSDGYLRQAMGRIGQLPGAVALVHCENEDIASTMANEIAADHEWSFTDWAETRPPLIEAEALQRSALIAADAACPFYAVHISSAQAIAAAKRMRGVSPRPMWIETNLHHLVLTQQQGARFDVQGLAKVSPPLRSESDVVALWKALAINAASTVGTDHCALDFEGKVGSVRTALPGFPALDNLAEMMVTTGLERGLDLQQISRITSFNAAQIFGLYPRKGTLRPGADGDAVLIAVDDEHVVASADNASFAKFSPYDGSSATARVMATIRRGQVVYRFGETLETASRGELVTAANS